MEPSQWCVLTDFDGTLSEIVGDPAAARFLPESLEALSALVTHVGTVGVISGRPLAFLLAQLPPSLAQTLRIAGSYGAEIKGEGEQQCFMREQALIDGERFAMTRLPPGVELESKPHSFTLHFRHALEHSSRVELLARDLEDLFDLRSMSARAAVEMFAHSVPSKGSIVATWGESFPGVCYVGDDVSDLEAFSILDKMEAGGHRVLRVAVTSTEGPPELAQRANVILNNPREAARWLNEFPSLAHEIR